MNIAEFPVEELGDYKKARQVIRETVLGSLPWLVAEKRLFSGFDGSCVTESTYAPSAAHISDNFIYAATAQEWGYRKQSGLAEIGHWATNYDIPAVGVYDLEQFNPVRGLCWQTKNGISVAETCTDIFIWR